MAEKNLPSPETLRKLLRYEPATGKLFWLPRPVEVFATTRAFHIWTARFAGIEAGRIATDGYRQIKVITKYISAHRVIWAMVTGAWPENQIDHINHDRLDNRWGNLRAVTNAENAKNRPIQNNNTSGATGVSWHSPTKKWQAKIRHERKYIYLGLYDYFEDALSARKSAELDYGFHENHGLSCYDMRKSAR